MSDILIVGGGPAGSVCAALCAEAGLRVTLLERATFPREKVCGDCLNPNCWPIFERLGLAGRVLVLPHAKVSAVSFVDSSGRELSLPLSPSIGGIIAVKRSHLDALLLTHARACGAIVCEGSPVTGLRRSDDGHWQVTTNSQAQPPRESSPSDSSMRLHTARHLIAADGRNSTVARLLGLLPPAARDRVGLQTHLPLPPAARERVIMRFLPQGYCGLADVGANQANLCLVAHPSRINETRRWASAEYALSDQHPWRAITPLERAAPSLHHPGLLLVGDAARVVEPFTGEGIYYALATGALAADCLIRGDLGTYESSHRALYRGRLWINLIARFACKNPPFASAFVRLARAMPGALEVLTRKVTRPLIPS